MTTLQELRVLLVDAQATAADPVHGALIEIGWAHWSARRSPVLPATDLTAHIVAAPPGAVLPKAVARLTGLRTGDWARGVAPATAWSHLLHAAEQLTPSPGPTPTVIHFARFEEPFLRALHARHGVGPFPFDLVCTHAIACRLLPELPRRTLRALAGYFGTAVPVLRRSGDHVTATAFVWHHLVTLLAERKGVTDLVALREWLARPVGRSPRHWPLSRERRRELPDRPGVYRLLRAGGGVLYVGKATALRQRVNGHLRAGASERALEMLTQARDVSWSETTTAVEAALLEADEIKRLAPPYNVALSATDRAVFFATAELDRLKDKPSPEHIIGPLASAAPIEALQALRMALIVCDPVSLPVRSRAVGVEPDYAPDPECFVGGLSRFVGEHAPVPTTRGLLRLGTRLWGRRLATTPIASRPQDAAADGPEPEIRRSRAWDEGRVAQALEEMLIRAAHAVRRARWLCRLSECSLAFVEPGAARLRWLSFEGGSVATRGDFEVGTPTPVPSGHARPPAARRAAFDLAAFDRLRVLTTELRRLVADAAVVELRFGPRARLSRRSLRAVLRWV